MNLQEDVLIDISTDFNNAIKPVLQEIYPEIQGHRCYKNKNIGWTDELLNERILPLKGSKISKSALISIKNVLITCQERITPYLKNEKIATGFLYFQPKRMGKESESSFYDFGEYTLVDFQSTDIVERFFIGTDIEDFDIDCSSKIIGRIVNGKIDIIRQDDPNPDNEVGLTVLKFRWEQNELEPRYRDTNPKSWEVEIAIIKVEFEKFCKKVLKSNAELLKGLKHSIKQIDFYLTTNENDYQLDDISMEKYFNGLSKDYLNIGFEEFRGIFRKKAPKMKVEFCYHPKSSESGPRLKYFINMLNNKYDLSANIDIWAEERFEIPHVHEKLSKYLRKQSSKTVYSDINDKTLPDDELYKLLKD